MKTSLSTFGLALAACILATWTASAAHADATVTITDMHVCCKGCSSAIEKAAAKVPGVKCVASEENESTVLTAESKATLQKAVDELCKAGFCGKPDDKEIKIAAIKTPDGKVQSLEIAHVHNCCGKCTDAMKAALADVKGIQSTTLQPKKTSFTIEGDFSAADAVKALEAAGFYPALKEPK
jgi:copper chaperone CopZ